MREPAAPSPSSPLRVLFTIGAAGALGDGELLDRFLDAPPDRAEAAFGLIVERHGPMVRHVCLAILRNPDDAADAFQATFLVLSRRARTIRARDSVGPWLFGVARRVSLRARSAADRRRVAERAKAERDAPRLVVDDPSDLPSADDWSTLYEELDRLPPRYRSPIVLCHLEGLTHEQAASGLGCPIGTLRTRLARGRDRLRARLLLRGHSPASVAPLLLSPASLPNAPLALASIGWASSASRIAVASRGLSLASLSVPLASATLRSMSMITFLRSLALGGVALSALGLGAGGYLAVGIAGEGDDPSPSPPQVASNPDTAPEPPEQDVEPPAPAEAPDRPGRDDIRIRSEIDAETSVIMALPDGKAVEKDDLILELDTNALKDDLANQQIATERADADYRNAIKTREVAEIEVLIYIEGHFPMEEASAMGEIELARAELELARDRVAETEKFFERGLAPELKLKEEKIEVLRAELKLKNAERALQILKEYEYERRIRRLEGEVEKAKADERAKMSRFELEEEKENRLRRIIEKSKLYAPASGTLRYPDDIVEGEPVRLRQRQLLFWIEDAPEPDAPPQAPE